MPLGKVGGDPEVHEARDDDSSRLETDREEGEARNGSQGLATLGLSESSSPNINRWFVISVGCAVGWVDGMGYADGFKGGNSQGYSRNH